MATAFDRAKALLKLAKSVDDGVLSDIAQIDDVADNPHVIPSAGEIGSGKETKEMRGMSAITDQRSEPGTPQAGRVKEYQELFSRLGRTEKAVADLAAMVSKGFALMGKAATAEGLDAASAKLRKAKVLLAKAEDDGEEDEEDFADRMDKAATALDGAKALIEKAEEEADDDEKEEHAEKARSQLRKLRAAMKAVREKRAADKIAKAEAEAAAKKAAEDAAAKKANDEEKLAEEEAKEKARLAAEATAKAAEGGAAASAPPVDPTVTKNFESITQQLGVLTASIGTVMNQIGGASRTAAAPVVVKADPAAAVAAATPKASEVVADELEVAADNGVLDLGAVIKARSLIGRLKAVEEGKLDRSVFAAEVDAAPENLKSLFSSASAA